MICEASTGVPVRGGDLLQQLRTPGVELWQHETQATHQQRDDNNQCCHGEQ
ncbi:hypothetical protein LNQ03_20445 [Klebsiella pneumoniae subsp. pneumoniae]|nr:hypothetical protein [Klebsiella pneumoniae subsp. pneumoniae]